MQPAIIVLELNPEGNKEFDAFLVAQLETIVDAEIGQKAYSEVECVARRAFYGTHYERLFPEPIPEWIPEDEDAERSRYLNFRVSPNSIETGLDIVEQFERKYPNARSRYSKIAQVK